MEIAIAIAAAMILVLAIEQGRKIRTLERRTKELEKVMALFLECNDEHLKHAMAVQQTVIALANLVGELRRHLEGPKITIKNT